MSGNTRWRRGLLAALGPLAAALGSLAGAPAFDPEAGLPVIRNFPPETYRGHGQIFATARDAAGVMFFGTYGQVVSFDGERWRQYPLPGTWTRTLCLGPDGLIYVGGGDQLGRLEPDPDSGELRFVSLADRLPAAHRQFASVWSAAAAGDRVLFAIDGAVLAWRGGDFHAWPFPGQRPAIRAAGSTVFCHVGDQLLRWHDGDWRPWIRDARLGAARRLTLLPADTGLLVALDQGLVLHADAAGTLAAWPTPAAEFLRRAGIRNGLRLADGTYVLTTAGEGVVQLSATGVPVRRLSTEAGLAHSATYGLAAGTDGHVWIETANGLSAFDPSAAWSLFDARNGRPDTIGGEPLRFGRELILAMSDVVSRRLVPAADAFNGARLAPFTEGVPGRISNGVLHHGGLLSGSERGIVRIDGVPRLLHATSSAVEDVCSLAAVPDVVVAGLLRGVELVHLAPDFAPRLLARVADFDLETTNIVEGPGRAVWIGTTSGVALRLMLAPDGTIASQTRFDAARGLPERAGWVKVHAFGREILACVKAGVFRLGAAGARFEPDPRFARHFPAGVNTLPIESDGTGRFWFQVRGATGNFEMGTLDVRPADGPAWTPLPAPINGSLGFSGARSINLLRERDGEFLWVSGTRSSVRLDLGASSPAPALPAVVISGIARGIRRWRPRADVLRLPFSREPLRLFFASPSALAAPVTYESRLLGYEEAWAPAPSPEATYTNLFGGPFTLEVRARDALGRAGEVARTTFSIAPPWHRTPGAYALYACSLAGAVAGFVRWRLGRARAEQRRLEHLVATRTAELATARDQAEAASRAKSAFLASMSHELRTPLNGVIGYAQILQADTRLAPDQQERVRLVQHSGEHLLHMINDVLDLAKIEAGKLELRPAPFALGDLLRDVTAGHAVAAARQGLAFTLDPAPDLPPLVLGDAQKLRQVLDNLLGNAVKFTASGSVTLRVRLAGSDAPPSTLNAQPITFAVTDTGPGIAPADQARLFQPFEQAAATRGDAPGTGLGLAISRALVERMGGALTLASTVGRGSTFSFTLPLPAAAAEPGRAPAAVRITGYTGPRRRVLIVDDHAINRGLLVDLLAPLGFACDAFASGPAALAHLAAAGAPPPDLALLDVRMSGLDGLALTRALRATPRDPALKVILLSASVLSFDPSTGLAAGADDFLAKPFRTSELLDRVARLLALDWIVATDPPPGPGDPSATAPGVSAIPATVRATLLDLLAQGDLDAFRATVARARDAHPAAAAHWHALDEAASSFQLPRLRQLLG